MVVAGVMVSVAEAVPGGGLAAMVSEFLMQDERLVAVRERLPVVAEERVVPADRAERVRSASAVVGGQVQAEGLLAVAQRVGVPLLLLRQERGLSRVCAWPT